MENITFQTNEQLWKIKNAAASAGYKKTNDCYWAQIFRNEETGHEFSTSREENSTNDPAADLVAMLTPAEEVPANECREYAKRIAEEAEAYYNGTTNEDGEEVSLYDYVADALDYEVILTSKKTVKAVRLYVTLGGPTCWIDTEGHAVICHWGTDREEYAIDWDLCDEIEEIIAEYIELDR